MHTYTLATMQNNVFLKSTDIDTSTSICAGHGEPERRGDRVQRAPRGERRRQRGGLRDQLPHLLHEAPGGGLIISGKTLQGEKSFKIDTPSEEEKSFFFPRQKKHKLTRAAPCQRIFYRRRLELAVNWREDLSRNWCANVV